jgi:glycosyltransferase involved in cell wall biosynthesis
MQSRVSIVIPSYNRKELLREAIASCLDQDYANLEVVVVDDGSTDGTGQSLQDLLNGSFGKVVYYRQQNMGTSAAKNAGLRIASGDYIQFLDSDDILIPRKISMQMEAIETSGYRAYCCLSFGRMGSVAAGWDKAERIGEQCGDWAAYLDRLCSQTVHVIHTSAPIWRKAFLASNSWWREDLSVSEDWEFYTRLMCFQPKIEFVAEDLFWVRAHEGEQLSKDSKNAKHWESTALSLAYVLESLRSSGFATQRRESGILDRSGGTYINVLRYANEGNAKDFERWLLRLALKRRHLNYMAAILLRRLLGKKALLLLFDMVKSSSQKLTTGRKAR